jgi:hypothetical protein
MCLQTDFKTWCPTGHGPKLAPIPDTYIILVRGNKPPDLRMCERTLVNIKIAAIYGCESPSKYGIILLDSSCSSVCLALPEFVMVLYLQQ